MPHHLLTNSRGFTLLETILVLVMIALFAVIAVSRQPSTDVTLKGQVESLRGHIRYAQMRAMNTDTEWGVGIGVHNIGEISYYGYWLFEKTTDAEKLVILPGEEHPIVDLNIKGISISATVETKAMNGIRFDTWGRPISVDNEANAQLLSNVLSIVLLKSSGSDTSLESLAISPETGFIQ